MRRADALIVGGGPAGAALALTLARGGARARVLERRPAPEGIVCGGFLGWDALAALDALGIDAWALGAHPIGRLRLIAGGRVIETALPHRAAGLSRRTLDAALLAAAEAAGTIVERGATVRAIADGAARLADGRVLAGDPLVVATGKHALRGVVRPGTAHGAAGLRTTVEADASLHGTIELHLFTGGYAGLLVQEDGRANLCLSISDRRLAAAGGAAALVAAIAGAHPAFAARLVDAGPGWDAIAGVPYGWRARDAGPWRVGDQAAVIASLVGDGVALALASGRAAGAALLAGEAQPAFQRRFAARARRPIGLAEMVRRAAERPAIVRAALPLVAATPKLLDLAARLTRVGG